MNTLFVFLLLLNTCIGFNLFKKIGKVKKNNVNYDLNIVTWDDGEVPWEFEDDISLDINYNIYSENLKTEIMITEYGNTKYIEINSAIGLIDYNNLIKELSSIKDKVYNTALEQDLIIYSLLSLIEDITDIIPYITLIPLLFINNANIENIRKDKIFILTCLLYVKSAKSCN